MRRVNVALLSALVSMAGAFGASVMTFESLAWSSGTGAISPPNGYKFLLPPYTEAGFTITLSPGAAFCQIATDNPNLYMGSTGLSACNANAVNTLTRVGGGEFTFTSIDLAPFGRNLDPDSTYGPGAAVTFIGQKAGGGTVTATFYTALPYEFKKYELPNTFNHLVSVSWTHAAPYHQYDNIMLDGATTCAAPTINAVSAAPDVLWPPNHKMVDITVTASATSDCGSVSCKITEVKSSEPVDLDGDWIFAGLALQLRAERNGLGNGRVYTISVQCADGVGGATTRSDSVAVPHDQRK